MNTYKINTCLRKRKEMVKIRKVFLIRTYHRKDKNNKEQILHNLTAFKRNLIFVGMKKAQLSYF